MVTRWSHRAGVVVGCVLGTWASAQPLVRTDQIFERGPIRVEAFTLSTSEGPARGLLARVNLADPSVEIVVSGLPENRPDDAEAKLVPTDEWAQTESLVLAVNANFFGKQIGAADATYADVLGLAISDGVRVSDPRSYESKPDPVLIFDRNGKASIGRLGDKDLSGAFDAVAGIGPSDSEPIEGGQLVTAGKNTGAGTRVEPANRHPRTAAGISADGRTLVLVVVDGRQPGWSPGVTLPELAEVLIAEGCSEAINLDGGGSSAFVFQPTQGAQPITNRPSDGRFRPVSTSLGIRLRDAGERSGASASSDQSR